MARRNTDNNDRLVDLIMQGEQLLQTASTSKYDGTLYIENDRHAAWRLSALTIIKRVAPGGHHEEAFAAAAKTARFSSNFGQVEEEIAILRSLREDLEQGALQAPTSNNTSTDVERVRRPRPKYQVFVSSTFTDLHEERQAVTWEVLKARHIPAGMENFPATDDRGWQVIQRTIDASDYYVLLVAGRYGSMDQQIGMSWTEREYRYAVEKKIPVLAFVRDGDSITSDKMERDESGRGRLEAFKKSLRDAHLCAPWKQSDDLAKAVAAALHQAIADDEDNGNARPGWYRGTQLPSDGTMDEFARLSSENQRLRERLRALGNGSALPRIVGSSGEDVRDISLDTVLLRQGPREHAPNEDPKVVQEYIDNLNRTAWIDLRVRNDGDRPAQNVHVLIDADGSDRIFLPDELSAPGTSVDVQALASDVPTRVAIVERGQRQGRPFIRMQVGSLGVTHSEPLLRFGIRSTRPLENVGDVTNMTVFCTSTDENGKGSSANFGVVKTITGTHALVGEPLAQLVTRARGYY